MASDCIRSAVALAGLVALIALANVAIAALDQITVPAVPVSVAGTIACLAGLVKLCRR